MAMVEASHRDSKQSQVMDVKEALSIVCFLTLDVHRNRRFQEKNTSSTVTTAVCEEAAQRSEVDSMWGWSVLMRLRWATCLSVHRKSERMQGGAHTGRCFVVAPCQERTIVKSTRLCFLSEGTVYSFFVCNLRPDAPAPPTSGTQPHICLAALVFF